MDDLDCFCCNDGYAAPHSLLCDECLRAGCDLVGYCRRSTRRPWRSTPAYLQLFTAFVGLAATLIVPGVCAVGVAEWYGGEPFPHERFAAAIAGITCFAFTDPLGIDR